MHCWICDWSPDVESLYRPVMVDEGERYLIFDEKDQKYVCSKCHNEILDSLEVEEA